MNQDKTLMKTPNGECGPVPAGQSLTTELLLLPDGRILVHSLTPAFAELLNGLNPDDEQIGSRACQITPAEAPETLPAS